MKQLNGIDAAFLYLETDETPMHVAGLTIYDLPKGFGGSFHKTFTEFFKGRVHLVPVFGMKLTHSSFNLDHPAWVDAGELDFGYHIQSIRLPKPGTRAQLEAAVARLHSERLVRDRPLWQFTVIEGLENRQAALYSKVHHSAVDGAASMAITEALYDLTPVPRDVAPPCRKDPQPIRPDLEKTISDFTQITANLYRQHANFLNKSPKIMSQLADLALPFLTGKLRTPAMLAPSTPINVSIDAERSYAARSISLQDAKHISRKTGTKLNDVVMAVTSGALRTYLAEKSALPDGSLVAFVPISLREIGNAETNNQTFGMTVSLATNQSDPLERLFEISAEADASKTIAGSISDAAPQDFTLLGAPSMLPQIMKMYGAFDVSQYVPQVVNLTISNTPGPSYPLYCAGAKVASLYPVSIPSHGVGLNVTVQSYLGHLDFGVTAGTRAMPDADHFSDLLVRSFEELRAAVDAQIPDKIRA